MSAAFRVTQRSAALGVQANLQANLAQMQRLENKLSSGKEILLPSDSPGGTASALSLRADIRRSQQQERNANDGAGWLAETDNALQSSSTLLRRARDLAVAGVNATMSSSDREALAIEVDGLRAQMLAVANTSRLGRPLFSGNATPGPGQPDVAYDSTGAYVGDSGTVMRSVGENASVQVNLTGPAVFGPAGADAMTVLTTLAINLRTNPSAIAPTDVANIDAALNRVQTGLSTVGARTNALETLQARGTVNRDNRISDLSTVESIDLPKTIMDLKLQETAYQAALAAAARVIQPSLMDFLR